MDKNRLEALLKNAGVNNLVSKEMVARARVASEASAALTVSAEIDPA